MHSPLLIRTYGEEGIDMAMMFDVVGCSSTESSCRMWHVAVRDERCEGQNIPPPPSLATSRRRYSADVSKIKETRR